jgi:hypothetical protein
MAPERGGGVVVWPRGYSLRREGGEFLVLDGRGDAVAEVGEEVRMGGQITQEEAWPTSGAARRNFEEERKELGVPDGCRGPLRVSSGVVG